MSDICIYDRAAEEFDNTGLSVLTPTECTVSEETKGMYELTLVQPIDHTNRWAYVANGNIVKASVPMRENPMYEESVITTETPQVTQTVTRHIWKVVHTTVGLRLRKGYGTSYKSLGTYKNGTQVVELGRRTVNGRLWIHCSLVKGGKTGYMSTKYLQDMGTKTETISDGKPSKVNRIVQFTPSRDQLFRIYSVEQDTERGYVSATARHIFYDLGGDIINGKCDLKNKPIAEAVAQMEGLLTDSHDFSFHVANGLEGTVTGDYSFKNPIEALLDPDEGMLSQVNALLVRDNFDVWIIPDTVRDMGVTIMRGKNLIGVTALTDTSKVVTRLIPCGEDVNNNPFWLTDSAGTGRYVDSEHINEYPYPLTQKIDVNVKLVKSGADNVETFANTTAGKTAARNKMRSLAREEFANGADLPDYTLDVNFVTLSSKYYADEYPEYASLQSMYLNDTVTVHDSTIRLTASVRVNNYEWDVLAEQYNSMTLGDLSQLQQTTYSYNLPTGGISGTKIAPNTASGNILREASIQYAKIAIAAIEQLTADSLSAQTAHINNLDAQTINTDDFAAALAHISTLIADAISAGTIETGTLIAEIARINSVSIAQANISFAKIVDADIQNLIAHDAITDKYFIHKLMVDNLQVIEQTVGNLVIKAADGNYYKMDIVNGTVSPTQVSVTQGEIESGVTESGKSIIETDLTATDLSATNIKGINALIDKITTSRIDATVLMANQAFIDALYTSQIFGEKSIEIIAGEAHDALNAIDTRLMLDENGLHIGQSVDGVPAEHEILINSKTNTIDFMFNGTAESSIAKDYHRFGNMEIRVPRVGGFVFQAVDMG